VFARRPRTKVSTANENVCIAVPIFVQYEIGVEHAVFQISPVEKCELAESSSLNTLEELLGNYLIGVDIRSIERRNDAGELREFFQISYLYSSSCSN